jgi:hypothetical protein
MLTYAGVGSRKAPEPMLDMAAGIATQLAILDYTLRSGHAIGMDRAFEYGCDTARGKKEIFLARDATAEAILMARTLLGERHWNNMGQWAQMLHARNCFQILGKDLNTPVKFLICWAEPDLGTYGGLTPKGGTRTAWRLAMEYDIPCYNLYSDLDRSRVMDIIHP